jgi:NADH dehydrogenase (ubiquinone) 1 alpha subcomplex subunit 8
MAERRMRSAELYAIAKHLAIKCHKEEVAFMSCKEEYKHPEDCLQEGKAVTSCAHSLLDQVMVKAPEQFKEYVDCLDHYSFELKKCRAEQKKFEEAFPFK